MYRGWVWPKSLSELTRPFFIWSVNTVLGLGHTSGLSLLVSQLTAESPSAETSCLAQCYATSLGTTYIRWEVQGLGLLPRFDTALKDHPSVAENSLLQIHHRWTFLSAHFCLHHPTQMLFPRVLSRKLHAHNSWSFRICFLGNLDIQYVLCLHSEELLLWFFPILWMSSILWWSPNSHNLVNFPTDICHTLWYVPSSSNESSLNDL